MSNSLSDISEKELAELSAVLCKNMGLVSDFFSGSRSEVFLPSKTEIIQIVELARTVLFPGFFGNDEISLKGFSFHVASCIDNMARKLKEQIKRGFCFGKKKHKMDCSDCEKCAGEITNKFISRLPSIQELLFLDAKAAYDGDPSATSIDECIYSYPGLLAITNYRIAHELYLMNVPIIPRIITEHAHSVTGIDIHPAAKIGKSFFIDHGTGVVIGETCIIGDKVRLYQGVTLGAKSIKTNDNGEIIKGLPRHPILEDDVVVYSGASVLGRITIGKGAVIGGNVWLTSDVGPGETKIR